jgi:hypothetical protein
VSRLVRLLAITGLVAGCTLFPVAPSRAPDGSVAYPAGCVEYGFSQRRCDAIVRKAEARLERPHPPVVGIELAPDPEPQVARTMAFTALVRFRFADGATNDIPFYCGVGGQYSIVCTETPETRVSSPTMGGYRDVPCQGEAPDGCATPLPTLDPAAADAARALTIAVHDIPIDRVGRYEVPLGQAVLPNGVLTEASFRLRDPLLQTLSTADGAWLEVRPVDPNGPPFDNYYMRGWHEGTETVDAVLVFEVVSFEPGATLELRDIVVR